MLATPFSCGELRVQQDFCSRAGCFPSLHGNKGRQIRNCVHPAFCGLGHYNMKAYLDVLSNDEFQTNG